MPSLAPAAFAVATKAPDVSAVQGSTVYPSPAACCHLWQGSRSPLWPPTPESVPAQTTSHSSVSLWVSLLQARIQGRNQLARSVVGFGPGMGILTLLIRAAPYIAKSGSRLPVSLSSQGHRSQNWPAAASQQFLRVAEKARMLPPTLVGPP